MNFLTFKIILIITSLKVSLQNDMIESLYENCDHSKDSDSNYKNILVNIICDGSKTNDSNGLPQRLIENHYSYNIKQLKLINFNVSTIPDNYFNKLIIEKLDLRDNQIENLSSKTFSGIKGLDFLDLSDNFLVKIEKGIFSNLSSLTGLSISKNLITHIEKDSFLYLNSLKSLDLSLNFFKEFDSSVLEPLKHNLENLILSNNKLEKFPDLSSLTEMNYIDMSYNLISEIDTKIPKKVKALTISNNKIANISSNIFNENSNLIFLDLSNNLISDIEKNSFQNLINLRILRLSHNLLSSIPNLSSMISLAELDLSNQGSTMRHINEFALERDDLPISTLNRLDLSNNQIESFDKRAFCSKFGPFEVEYLVLDNNPIKSLDPCMFNQLQPARMTIFFNSNNQSNCDCEVVNYLSGLNINLFSDCDLNEMTRCSRTNVYQTNMCSDLGTYSCLPEKNDTILNSCSYLSISKFVVSFNILVLFIIS
ncbi:unnamed protein product [Brachionus calyciflorus]|uniref:Uncharacterized protein n=1 Tax=Brachionus calyciflorus TaxID=104777 RepID=A0A813ZAY1_9BILA|nr:unnamed protein product [Brachionus calyciflorus]